MAQMLGSSKEQSILMTTSDGDGTVISCSMESDLSEFDGGDSFLQSFLDVYSSADDSEDDGNDHEVEQQSPETPEMSYLSFVELERSADKEVHGDSQQQPSSASTAISMQPWNGYCIYGDNIDKNLHPRHQTVSRQTKSLHLFHSFAQFDRVNLLGVSDTPPLSSVVEPELLMPSLSDLESVKSRFAVMISRYVGIKFITFNIMQCMLLMEWLLLSYILYYFPKEFLSTVYHSLISTEKPLCGT